MLKEVAAMARQEAVHEGKIFERHGHHMQGHKIIKRLHSKSDAKEGALCGCKGRAVLLSRHVYICGCRSSIVPALQVLDSGPNI